MNPPPLPYSLEIEPGCEPVPAFWKTTLIGLRAQTLQVGQFTNLKGHYGGLVSLFLHRLADDADGPKLLLSTKGGSRVPRAEGAQIKGSAWGQPLWRKIHLGGFTLETAAQRAALIEEILQELPAGRCDCQAHARQYIKDHPIDTSSWYGFFVWGFVFHNAVNTRLDKPLFTIEQAVERWQPEIT